MDLALVKIRIISNGVLNNVVDIYEAIVNLNNIKSVKDLDIKIDMISHKNIIGDINNFCSNHLISNLSDLNWEEKPNKSLEAILEDKTSVMIIIRKVKYFLK